MNRAANLQRLQAETFDVLVVGGGATGAGVAVDAATRGLKVALVERDDFASGTSSRSTKLVHGGVRYLEAAVTQLDRAQFRLVREALAERATLLHIAPHLARPLRTVVPAYSWLAMAFYRVGLWLYDRAAGAATLGASRLLSQRALLDAFPRLRRKGLKGGVAYWDGQFDDARMAITLVLTAAEAGAAVANRIEVTGLTIEQGRVVGAELCDRIDGRSFPLRARAIVNATGPQADHLRRLEDAAAAPRMAPSRGTHLALDRGWAPEHDGLLIPQTSDGRVLFLLPWQGRCIAGTTDIPANPDTPPTPTDADIDYLLGQLAEWMQPAPKRDDVRAAWAGLRPLISANATSSARIVREHHVSVGPHGMVTIAGGKWTTYRRMAEDTVDAVVASAGLAPQTPCATRDHLLVGATGFQTQQAAALARDFDLDADVAEHLVAAYGTRAADLLQHAPIAQRQRLAAVYPYLEAEVTWARDREMALDADDILMRRTRLWFLDQTAAEAARPRVAALLTQH